MSPEEYLNSSDNTRFYGIAKSKKGRIYPFMVTRRDRVPDNHLTLDEVKVTSKLMLAQVWDKAVALAESYGQPAVVRVQPGAVACHLDHGGKHLALILAIKNRDCKALFITSNPFWGLGARELTADEVGLCGLFTRNKTSYFSPVIRSLDDFVGFKPATFSNDRVRHLLDEFSEGFDDEADRYPSDFVSKRYKHCG